VLDAPVFLVRRADQPASPLQFGHGTRDLGLVHRRLLTEFPGSHGSVLAKPGQGAPFRACQAKAVLVDARELAADQIGQMIEPVGQESFQFEDIVLTCHGAHSG